MSGSTFPPQILVAEDGEEIAVSIIPPPDGVGHDRAFAANEYLRAMAHARLIRLQFGYRIVDRTDNTTRLRALARD